MHNEKIAEELPAQTRRPQDAYEYAIRREKSTEHSHTIKIYPFGNQTTTTTSEPKHYINTRGRNSYANNQGSLRSRGGFRCRPYPRGTQITRGRNQQCYSNFNNQKQCCNCGNQFGRKHLQPCPTKNKFCSKCAKRGHFAKMCQ